MKNKIVAKRYGDAFIAFAAPRIGIANCVQEMKNVHMLLRESPDLVRLFKAPEIPLTDKNRIVDKVFLGNVADELRTFIKHLLLKGRITALDEVAVYVHATYGHGQAVEILLRTTFPVDLGLVEKIKSVLQRRVGGEVKLYLEMDPALLGGIQVVMGNNILDASVSTRLAELRKHLLKI